MPVVNVRITIGLTLIGLILKNGARSAEGTLHWVWKPQRADRSRYREQNSVFKASVTCLYDRAWNIKGSTIRGIFAGFSLRVGQWNSYTFCEARHSCLDLLGDASSFGINRGERDSMYQMARGEILGPIWDRLQRRLSS